MPIARIVKTVLAPVSGRAEPQATQYGAIPYRIVDGQPVFLMITSRRSANWVFPKGSAIKGLSPSETAAQETFEEAGVRGEVGQDPVGYYLNLGNETPPSLVRVALFPLHVTEQLDEWPEEPQRFRHWALLPQARSLLASKQAADVVAKLNRRLLSGAYPPGSSRVSE